MTDKTTNDIETRVRQLGAADAGQRAEAAERLCRAGTDAISAAVPLVRHLRSAEAPRRRRPPRRSLPSLST